MDDEAIRVEELVKVYGRRGREVRAVDGLSFAVQRGTIFGLLGPNGAGKTTTVRVLTTLARPTSGRAAVLGRDVVLAPLEVRRRIGVVIQEQAADLLLSVRDNLLTFLRFRASIAGGMRARVEDVMVRFGLDRIADRKVQDLSGGVRRRVQVAKMFLVDLPVVFLDEFSTGMDALLKRAVMDLLRADAARGRTFVLTTHILSEAEELCDDILIINAGRQVARGSVAALKLRTDHHYAITVSFDRVPEQLDAITGRFKPISVGVVHDTVTIRLRETESRVLELLSDLTRNGHVQRIEVGGATLEDIFVDLIRNPETRS